MCDRRSSAAAVQLLERLEQGKDDGPRRLDGETALERAATAHLRDGDGDPRGGRGDAEPVAPRAARLTRADRCRGHVRDPKEPAGGARAGPSARAEAGQVSEEPKTVGELI